VFCTTEESPPSGHCEEIHNAVRISFTNDTIPLVIARQPHRRSNPLFPMKERDVILSDTTPPKALLKEKETAQYRVR
jgi:hypothetical protein